MEPSVTKLRGHEAFLVVQKQQCDRQEWHKQGAEGAVEQDQEDRLVQEQQGHWQDREPDQVEAGGPFDVDAPTRPLPTRFSYQDVAAVAEELNDLAERLAPLGSDGFNSSSQFENYRGGLYGLKPGGHRLLLTRVGSNAWVVVDAFSKADINKTSAQTKRMNAARETIAAFLDQLKRQRSQDQRKRR